VTHEELCAPHEEFIEQHASLIKVFERKLKRMRAHHMDQMINCKILLTLVIREKSMYPPLVMIY
jgi:flagellar biosynthesis chaperone FliJ